MKKYASPDRIVVNTDIRLMYCSWKGYLYDLALYWTMHVFSSDFVWWNSLYSVHTCVILCKMYSDRVHVYVRARVCVEGGGGGGDRVSVCSHACICVYLETSLTLLFLCLPGLPGLPPYGIGYKCFSVGFPSLNCYNIDSASHSLIKHLSHAHMYSVCLNLIRACVRACVHLRVRARVYVCMRSRACMRSHACVWKCVCVCVCERERERERES